jgi:putative hydroxymethylpyrimidine transport system substrate-binding protein
MSRPLSLLLAVFVLAAAVTVAGCGDKKDALGPDGTDQLSLLLDYFPNADHAGIYAAQAQGRFRDVGLDLKIRQPSDPAAPIKQVAAGRTDLAISYEPELLRARDQGLHVVSVAALVRKPLTSVISLPHARVRRVADLKGKTVGTAGIDYQTAYLQTILANANVDPKTVKQRNVGFNLNPALLTKKVDATLGGFWNYEGIELRQRKKRPQIIPVDRAGVPTYDELVVVANADSLDRDKDKIRRFIGALARGTAGLDKDPAKGIQGLLRANPDLDPKLQRASVKATLPLFLPAPGKPFGYQDPGDWQRFTAWMRENKLLNKIPDASGAFTNRLLPGQGL